MSAISTISDRMAAQDWLRLATLSVLWGGTFFFVEIALDALPPLTIVALRVAIGAATLWTVAAFRGLALPRDRRLIRAFLTMGLLNNAAPFTLIVYAQTQIEGGLASILNATTPLFTVVVAALLLPDERLTLAKAIGVLVGLAGAVAVIGPDALLEADAATLFGPLAVLCAALSYAFAAAYGRRFKSFGLPPLLTAAGQLTASSLILAPLALALDQPWRLASLAAPEAGWAGALAAVLALATLSTALAYLLYFRVLASSGATNAALVTFLIPVSAILLGAAFLGETLAPRHLLGMGLIGLGLSVIDGRLWRAGRRPERAKPGSATPGSARSGSADPGSA